MPLWIRSGKEEEEEDNSDVETQQKAKGWNKSVSVVKTQDPDSKDTQTLSNRRPGQILPRRSMDRASGIEAGAIL